MKVAIYGQKYIKETAQKAVEKLIDVLLQKEAQVFIEHEFLEVQDAAIKQNAKLSTFKALDTTYDLLISVGGDGTILRAIAYVGDLGIPVVGVNTGRLGFLATIQIDDIQSALTEIFNGEYKISERALLSVSTDPEHQDIVETHFALNEIAISRKNTTSMITIETHLDDEFLTSYWADGLILSTPTGSTGYSLSCGGPVIAPKAKNFALTPISPHNLSARPLILPDNTTVTLRVNGRAARFLMA